MAALPLLLLLLSSSVRASWSSSNIKQDQVTIRTPQAPDEVNLLLAEMERKASLRPNQNHEDHTTPSSSNPSCFYHALTSLSTEPSSESPCDLLARNELLRTETAARMALCEIKTSSQKIPRECEDWQNSNGRKNQVRSCVDGLSRSPQYWSSYGGYLREVVTLCSSFKRWSDLETARNLHASTAVTFAEFVAKLKEYEVARAQREDLREVILSDLSSLTEKLSSLTSILFDDRTKQTDQLNSVQTSLAESISNFEHSILDNLAERLPEITAEFQLRGFEFSEEMKNAFRELGALHRDALELTVNNVRDSLSTALDGMQGSISRMGNDLDFVESRNSMVAEIAHSALKDVTSIAQDITGPLRSSFLLAQDMNTLQMTTLELNRELISVVQNFTTTVHQSQTSYFNFKRSHSPLLEFFQGTRLFLLVGGG